MASTYKVMLYFLLLLGTVFSTNDDCAYYSAGFPLGICYYTDSLYFDRSVGYFCAANNDSIDTGEYTVEYRVIENSICDSTSDDTVATFTCDDTDPGSFNYCNCGGTIEDCSEVQVGLYSCDSSGSIVQRYILYLCFATSATASSLIDCDVMSEDSEGDMEEDINVVENV